MTQSNRPQHHRKFIAIVLSAALAVTGISAVPARADNDVGKVVAGIAVLGILGAALHRHNTRDRRHQQVTRPYQPQHPKPIPQHFRRYDLPARCVRYFPNYSHEENLVARGCLRKNYQYEASLPQQCRVTFWNGDKHRTGYRPKCLTKRGYRLITH
ncbi:hypothetical protein RSK20926_09372 [Roseobacter sp. SK209-2-6]|uniref:hypothetical protein n=1 Tax=Roseobacter sp. SK209-2-6 TaxID=388739 RepID=UPI0000F3D0F2|nr:hypothetical protein [Roseobacter sp. SK209-2-6]EBA17170.1 hypothetical protein RSK20926_09372 [Roseobacter sp. SK209-2-6]